MEIREFFSEQNKSFWLSEIEKSDWGAGKFLFELLNDNRLRELCGENTKVFLLTEKEKLLSFCTLAGEDDIRDSGLTPWIGFVYTFPEYRGLRLMGKLLTKAYETAKEQGAEFIYISTNETGLYEKYGYSFFQMMKDMEGEPSRVYRRKVDR